MLHFDSSPILARSRDANELNKFKFMEESQDRIEKSLKQSGPTLEQ